VLDDGRILNIAGDYIAHGIRHRASELVTRELGHQSEIELQTKLQNEVEAERVTRLDKLLLTEQREQGVIDLRPGEGATWLVRENRNLMIGRVRHLERYGVATELEPGRCRRQPGGPARPSRPRQGPWPEPGRRSRRMSAVGGSTDLGWDAARKLIMTRCGAARLRECCLIPS
jgi:hypothetical protein